MLRSIVHRAPGLKKVVMPVRAQYRRYFSEAGYVSRAINYRLSAWQFRDEILHRRSIAARAQLPAAHQQMLEVMRRDGAIKSSFRDFALDGAPVLAALSARAREYGERQEQEIQAARQGYSKTYWTNLFDKSNPQMKPVVDFACNEQILKLVACYLGELPALLDITYYYSPPTQDSAKLIGSQGWHLDNEHRTKVKIFLSPVEMTEENGPTTYLMLPDSDPRRFGTYPDYFDDEQGRKAGVPIDKRQSMLAQPGEFYLADTSRLFHYGARAQTKPRWLAIITYAPLEHNLWPEPFKPALHKNPLFQAENERILKLFDQVPT